MSSLKIDGRFLYIGLYKIDNQSLINSHKFIHSYCEVSNRNSSLTYGLEPI